MSNTEPDNKYNYNNNGIVSHWDANNSVDIQTLRTYLFSEFLFYNHGELSIVSMH